MSCVRVSYLFPFQIEWISGGNATVPLSVLIAIEDTMELIPMQVKVERKLVLFPNNNLIDYQEAIDAWQSPIEYIKKNVYTYEGIETVIRQRNDEYNPTVDVLSDMALWSVFLITKDNKFVAWASGEPLFRVIYRETKESKLQKINVDQYIHVVMVDANYRGRNLCVKLIDIIFNRFKSMGTNTVALHNVAGKIGEKCYLHGGKYYDVECLERNEDQTCGIMKFTLKSH